MKPNLESLKELIGKTISGLGLTESELIIQTTDGEEYTWVYET